MTKQFDHPRVQPPGGDEESLREYGRQLMMDSLLELALGDHGDKKASPCDVRLSAIPARPRGLPWRKAALLAATLAASLVLGVALWKSLRPEAPPTKPDRTKQNDLAVPKQPSTNVAKQLAPARLTPDEIRSLPATEWGYEQAARGSPEDLVMLLEHHANVQLPLIPDNDWKQPDLPSRF